MRIVSIAWDHQEEKLFGATNRGSLARYNSQLHFEGESEPGYKLNSVFGIRVVNNWIVGREISGSLVVWDKNTLRLTKILSLEPYLDPEVAHLPNVCHGLFHLDDFLLFSSTDGQLAKFSAIDFSFKGFVGSPTKALLEHLEFDGTQWVGVDFSGQLYHGNLDQGLKPIGRLCRGATHVVRRDPLNNRYWFTDDARCGIGLIKNINPNASTLPKTNFFNFTQDDVEDFVFSDNFTKAWVGCFDRYIYEILNQADLVVSKKIGPLPYQIVQIKKGKGDTLFILTEAGHLAKVDPNEAKVEIGGPSTGAIWDIKKIKHSKNEFLISGENGLVSKVRIEKEGLTEIKKYELNTKWLIRRIEPLGDGFVGIDAHGVIFRVCDDKIIFEKIIPSLLRDLKVTSLGILVCSEQGDILLLDSQTGTPKWSLKQDHPQWALAVSPDERFFLAGSRRIDEPERNGEDPATPNPLILGHLGSGKIEKVFNFSGNIKRIEWSTPNEIFINGNGNVGAQKIEWPDMVAQKKWDSFQLNTCETLQTDRKKVWTTTYGFQLNTYDISGEILSSVFPFEDYATSSTVVAPDLLLVGGRGPFLTLFDTRLDEPRPYWTFRS